MPRDSRLNFNRGILSELAVGRQDLDRTQLASTRQNNWIPRIYGAMMLRPGLQFIGATDQNNQARYLPFIFSATDTALIELTNGLMRVLVNELPVKVVAVTAAVVNGTFNTTLNSWTDADEAGATSVWLAGGYMSLTGTGYNRAIRTQQVTVTETNSEHFLKIVIQRGPVTLRVGSSSGAEDYVTETNLGTGVHFLSFTPTGDFHIHLSSRTRYATLVDTVVVANAGDISFTTPWTTALLRRVRYSASGDVIYCACEGTQQRKIERRATRSWSLVLYEPGDGPFRIENVSSITLTPSAQSGDITLTASTPLFKTSQVGALFTIDSIGQKVSALLTGSNQFTDEIRVTGVGASRTFIWSVSGTYTGDFTLQMSVGEPGAWTDVFTANGVGTDDYNDVLDNQIIYYRIGFKPAAWLSGSATMTLTYSSGSISGVAKVTAFTSTTVVSAVVLKNLGNTVSSDIWAEGAWSDYRGYPSSVALYEGRIWWAGKNKIYGSISDAYESFDDTLEGDSGTISRSIGEGPIDNINWMLPLERLLLSTASSEQSAKSSSFDEPLSPTAFGLKRFSTLGSAKIGAVELDAEGIFVQRSGLRVYNLPFDPDRYNYTAVDMTALVPEIGDPGFVHLAVQRQPDTRVHCVRSDGVVAVLIYDRLENVRCWVTVETEGVVEDVVVLPADKEDAVYYVVKRVINGGTKRYLERWAIESECRGGLVSKLADSFVYYSGSPSASMSGLLHLEGEAVVVWGDGKDLGVYTVTGGVITLSEPVSDAVIGLSYMAQYQSTKLKELDKAKRIHHVGLMLASTHYQGLRYGPDFSRLDDLPQVEDGDIVAADTVWEAYHKDVIEFDGSYDVDSRVCLEASAPRAATVLAILLDYDG